MSLYDALVDRVLRHNPQADTALIQRAWLFVAELPESKDQDLGTDRFHFSIYVANILADLHLDSETIVTAILYGAVEAAAATRMKIEQDFGPNIASLVDGVTTLSRLDASIGVEGSAKSFRNLLFAMSEDVRVLLVKLADRMQAVRSLHEISDSESRRHIAVSVMEIYAPIAYRIGMFAFMAEMENLAFKELEPGAYDAVTKRLEQLKAGHNNLVSVIGSNIRKLLDKTRIEAKVHGREKGPYSIWQKMQRRNTSLDHLSDIVQFRVTVDTDDECYRVLAAIHRQWPAIIGRFKDFISVPRRNGYRALHTEVLYSEQMRIPIQICTTKMDHAAEFGAVAHLQSRDSSDESEADAVNYPWFEDIVDIVSYSESAEGMGDRTRLTMFRDHVFVFTPKGQLFQLPAGACPIDLAYAIHTELGHSCLGAKINGRVVPLRTILTNGDQIEILRGKLKHPDPAWLDFVVSKRALEAIRRFMREGDRAEAELRGERLANNILSPFLPTLDERAIDQVVKQRAFKNRQSLMLAIATGKLTERDVIQSFFPNGVDALTMSLSDTALEQNPRVPVFVEAPDGRIAPGPQVGRAGSSDPEGFTRRHALAREALLEALASSGRGKTQASEIAETIRKAVDALGKQPEAMQSERYIIVSKSLRREILYRLSPGCSVPPLSERQNFVLEQWVDADAALVGLDEELAACENAMYNHRFGKIGAERDELQTLFEEVKRSGIATEEALSVLGASLSNLTETGPKADVDLQVSGQTISNFLRAFGRKISKLGVASLKSAKGLWVPGTKLVQWIASHSAELKIQFPALTPVIDFLVKWLSRSD